MSLWSDRVYGFSLYSHGMYWLCFSICMKALLKKLDFIKSLKVYLWDIFFKFVSDVVGRFYFRNVNKLNLYICGEVAGKQVEIFYARYSLFILIAFGRGFTSFIYIRLLEDGLTVRL